MRSLKFLNKNKFSNLKKYFSTINHSQIIVIGAGTGGLAVSAQLCRESKVDGKNITIFDPSSKHYYQPGYTKLAGGILNSTKMIEYNVNDFTNSFNFQNKGINQIDPENNIVKTADNEIWTYDQLVIAAGLELKLDSIPGKLFI
jgi:sulfide:quinone oxidoreductase